MLKLRAMRARLYGIRFELLMLSLWCVFILNILFPDNIYRGIAQAIYLPIQLLAALVLFEFKRKYPTVGGNALNEAFDKNFNNLIELYPP